MGTALRRRRSGSGEPTCDDDGMSEGGDGNESFQERIQWIVREVNRTVEQLSELDVDEIAKAIGVDAERARGVADTVGRWFSEHGEPSWFHPREDSESESVFSRDEQGSTSTARAPRRGAGPHPLDLPTEAQGLALGALDSGRWTVEPGSNLLRAHGEGPEPEDALGLVGELRARDWIDASGQVTLLGRRALSRWSGADETD